LDHRAIAKSGRVGLVWVFVLVGGVGRGAG
jgi:hypothetical protein